MKLEHSLRRVPYSSPFKMTDSGDNTSSYLLRWSHLSEEMSATNLSWQMHAVLFSVFLLNFGKRVLPVGGAAFKVIAEGEETGCLLLFLIRFMRTNYGSFLT